MKTINSLLLSSLFISSSVLAGHEESYDYARVVNAEPILKTIHISTPRQECWDEPVAHYEKRGPRSATPTIVGAIVGGLIGNELGHHQDAKRAGIAAGAILGGSIGRDIGSRSAGPDQRYYSTEQVCQNYQDSHQEERVVGYHVSYQYQGRLYHTRTQNHPGKRLKVQVSVTPVDEY